jgi:excisionase family DNA binding protein
MNSGQSADPLASALLALFERIAERVYERKEAERRARETPPGQDEVLTVKQVAQLKGVKPRTVYDWVAQKKIQFHYTPGGHLRFYRRHVEEDEG